MNWVTKRKIRISRAATCWLIQRFVDRDATFTFCETDADVVALEGSGAIGFHSPGTRYAKSDGSGRAVFERLVAEHQPNDRALERMAKIVRDADGPAGREREPEAAGLRMCTVAFPDICSDDHEIVARSSFLYDSLYAALAKGSGAWVARTKQTEAL